MNKAKGSYWLLRGVVIPSINREELFYYDINSCKIRS